MPAMADGDQRPKYVAAMSPARDGVVRRDLARAYRAVCPLSVGAPGQSRPPVVDDGSAVQQGQEDAGRRWKGAAAAVRGASSPHGPVTLAIRHFVAPVETLEAP